MTTLVLLAHPDLAASMANKAMAEAAAGLADVTVHDLHAAYPDARIDVEAEQRLADAHATIVFQFPLYWYSTPPILKAWQDDVLTLGWAYDPLGADGTGVALKGKTLACAVTTGAPITEYEDGGWNGHAVADFLLPIAGTANFLQMGWREPFVAYATWAMDADALAATATAYCDWLTT